MEAAAPVLTADEEWIALWKWAHKARSHESERRVTEAILRENGHPAMLAALERFVTMLDTALDEDWTDDEVADAATNLAAPARAALALARGGVK